MMDRVKALRNLQGQLLRSFLLLCLLLVFFLATTSSSFASLRRVEECGIEGYNSKADQACGVQSYNLSRTSACGVEKYNSLKSKSCPDYQAPLYKTEEKIFLPYPSCDSGYDDIGHSSRMECSVPDVDWRNKPIDSPSYRYFETKSPHCHNIFITQCEKPEVITTCRLPQFGVETWNQCRDISHGVESYNTCSRPEFGAIFNQCEILKTKAELNVYIEELKNNLDLMGVALLQNEANLLKAQGSEIGLACFIKKWDSDPLYSDVVAELKSTQFPALFGVTYDPKNYDCSGQSQINLPTGCDSGETTPKCKSLRAYKAAREYLDTKKTEVSALTNDVVSRSDSSYKQQLEDLNTKIQEYMKP